MGAEIYRRVQLGERRRAARARARRRRPARPSRSAAPSRSSPISTSSSPPSSSTTIGLGAPRRKAVTAAPLAPVPEESVSPTPRSKIRARTRLPSIARKETLVRLGNSSWPSISGPIAPRSSSSSSSPTTIAHCGLPIETCWNSHSRPPALERPPAVLAAGGEVLGGGRGPAHVDRAGQLAGDRRPDRPGDGADRELVLVGPAVAAQVEDRLAGAVAGELGLGAVGVEDPQLGDELRVLAAREQQDPVGADPEMRVAEPLDPLRGQLPGQPLCLEDQVVVAQRLPLLEFHGAAAYSAEGGDDLARRPRRRRGRCGRSRCRLGILRIQVSWRRA